MTRLQQKYKDRLDEQLLDRVFEQLNELNFLDDDQFARDFVRAKAARGKGPRWIRQALLQKGVGAACVAKVLDETDVAVWIEHAKQMLEKRAAVLERTPEKQRSHYAYRYLSQRGFQTATIRAAIDEMGL